MPRVGPALALLLILSSTLLSGCGSTSTELAESGSPLNGTGCDEMGAESGSCTCIDDERWLCARQNSVTCNAIYGSGGGRLLVTTPDEPCEMEWSSCSDERVYASDCNGLSCSCVVNGVVFGEFITPRCTDLREAGEGCGWSVGLPGGVGGAIEQGLACPTPGETDPETGCRCIGIAWDCPTRHGCGLGGAWQGDGQLSVRSDGVFEFSAAAASFSGTWEQDGSTLHVRSAHESEPECVSELGTYELALSPNCDAVELRRLLDDCAARSQALDGFRGAARSD